MVPRSDYSLRFRRRVLLHLKSNKKCCVAKPERGWTAGVSVLPADWPLLHKRLGRSSSGGPSRCLSGQQWRTWGLSCPWRASNLQAGKTEKTFKCFRRENHCVHWESEMRRGFYKTITTLKRINNLQRMAKERYSQKTGNSKNSSQSNSLFVAINTNSKHLWKDRRFFWVLPQSTQGSQSWYVCSVSEYRKQRFTKWLKTQSVYESHSHRRSPPKCHLLVRTDNHRYTNTRMHKHRLRT